MKKAASWTAIGVVVTLLAIQVIPVNRTNPPVEGDLVAPEAVHSILERACYDCHSNETAWPWYSRIAPISWQIVRDVEEGREALNYSNWNRLTREESSEMVYETWEEVAEGVMPPRAYLALHPEARLSESDRATLREWGSASGSVRPDDR